jgi:Mn-dependent DtxR family transcriptional regulator
MRKGTIEDYVEIVYLIQNKKKKVHTKDIALSLNINPASVTEIFQKLSSEGYINYKKYGGVTLTEKGRRIAIKIKNRHEVLKNFLIILGIDERIAEEDACRIEHFINPETLKKLRKFVEYADLGCSKWLDYFKHYEETGKYVKCEHDNMTNNQ